jgi:hypothetical protein
MPESAMVDLDIDVRISDIDTDYIDVYPDEMRKAKKILLKCRVPQQCPFHPSALICDYRW